MNLTITPEQTTFAGVAGEAFAKWFKENESKLAELFTPALAESEDIRNLEEFGFAVFSGEFEVV